MDAKLEAAISLENLRRLFRRTMAMSYARPDEPLEETVRRLRADPNTARVAEQLACTVDELLEGFGTEEPFIVDADYDHAEMTAAVEAIVDEALAPPAEARDEIATLIRVAGARRAPHVSAARGQIRGDRAAQEQIRSNMRRQLEPALARRRR